MLRLKQVAIGLLACTGYVYALAADYQTAFGFGTQYGGVLGIQHSSVFSRGQLSLSTGLIGLSIGAHVAITENHKHTIGAYINDTFLGFGFLSRQMLVYSYHTSGFSEDGWVFGVSGGYQQDEDWGVESNSTTYSFEIGYKF